jgi:light-regulated signal transduction histidine kinase (bacteriophytochrome)
MITCHHYSPRNIPHYTRLAALLQGHFLTSQIDVREAADQYELKIRIEQQLQQLLESLTSNDETEIHSFHSPLLLQITNASGVAVMHNGQLHTNGDVPPEPELVKLADWAYHTARMSTLYTSKLIDIYPDAAAIVETTAGLIYHSLGKSPQDCIIWFRPEVEKSINWAGDPAKAIVKEANEENNYRLSPRKSFELWKEIVRYQSREWQPAEIQAAESLAFFLQRQFNLVGSLRAENKYRLLSEKLQAANEELANINWISIHDLKEPLRKMQIFASRALANSEEPLPSVSADAVKRIQQSAARMQVLIDDLLAYSKITNNKSLFTPVDLNKLIHDLKGDLSEEIAAKAATITYDTLPTIPMILFQARQLFANLLGNALKFSRDGVAPHITVTAEQAQPDPAHDNGRAFYKISVQDNGIGFDNAYAARIFDVFKRLHTAAKYEGTGIGLAICKKIAESHGGYITAAGRPGGATFHVYLPATTD